MPNTVKFQYADFLRAGLRRIGHVDADNVVTLTCGTACSGTDIAILCWEFFVSFVNTWLGTE
eukprot:5879999-Prorocentrum_lima.AAC.1